MTQLWFLTVHFPSRLTAHRNISTLHQNSAFFQRLMIPTAGFGVTSNRFGSIENVPCSTHLSLCTSFVVPRLLFSSQPAIPLKQHYRVDTMPYQCIARLRADAWSGWFRSIDTLRFVLNSNSNFQIRQPFPISGSDQPQLHLGTSKPTSCIYPVA